MERQILELQQAVAAAAERLAETRQQYETRLVEQQQRLLEELAARREDLKVRRGTWLWLGEALSWLWDLM